MIATEHIAHWTHFFRMPRLLTTSPKQCIFRLIHWTSVSGWKRATVRISPLTLTKMSYATHSASSLSLHIYIYVYIYPYLSLSLSLSLRLSASRSLSFNTHFLLFRALSLCVSLALYHYACFPPAVSPYMVPCLSPCFPSISRRCIHEHFPFTEQVLVSVAYYVHMRSIVIVHHVGNCAFSGEQ